MSGKPITVSLSEYSILSQAKEAFEESSGKPTDWGQFLLFLLGIYIRKEVVKSGSKSSIRPKKGPET